MFINVPTEQNFHQVKKEGLQVSPGNALAVLSNISVLQPGLQKSQWQLQSSPPDIWH